MAAAVHPAEQCSRRYLKGRGLLRNFDVSVPGLLSADATSLEVELSDVRLVVQLHDLVEWPLTLGGGGVFSLLPFVGQYWHPHVLGRR